MGFDPGDFRDSAGRNFSWELEDGPRIVLWNADETIKLLDLEVDGASRAAELLNLLVAMARGDV